MRVARCTLVLGLLLVLVLQSLLIRLFETLLLDCSHDEVEVAFCLAVGNLVEHDLRLNVDTCSLSDEDSLQALQHLEDVHWVHAAVLVVIAQLEHQLDLLVLGDSREQVAAKQKVNDVHLVASEDAFAVTSDFQRLEPVEQGLNQVLRRLLVWELLVQALGQVGHGDRSCQKSELILGTTIDDGEYLL